MQKFENELPVGVCTYFPGPVPTWKLIVADTYDCLSEAEEELYAAPATASFDLVYDKNEDYTPLCDYIKAVGGSNVNQDKACTYSAGSVIVEFEVQFTEAELQSAGSSADDAASFVDGLITENTAVQLPEIDGQAVSAPTIAVTSAPVVADESDDDDAEDDDDSDPIVSEGAAVHSNAIVGATIVAAAALTCSM